MASVKGISTQQAREDYRIWQFIQKVLLEKDADAAMAALKNMQVKDERSKLFAAQKLFEAEFAIVS